VVSGRLVSHGEYKKDFVIQLFSAEEPALYKM